VPSSEVISTPRQLSRDTLDTFKVSLSSALRTTDHADETLSQRFVELRPGTVAALEAKVNHLITGRRGVGKSTTLAVLQQRAQQQGAQVIFVDVETHKTRAYPDVLTEIIIDIIDAIRPKPALFGPRRDLRRRINQLEAVL
jgi:signal recognition particle GTPase